MASCWIRSLKNADVYATGLQTVEELLESTGIQETHLDFVACSILNGPLTSILSIKHLLCLRPSTLV